MQKSFLLLLALTTFAIASPLMNERGDHDGDYGGHDGGYDGHDGGHGGGHDDGHDGGHGGGHGGYGGGDGNGSGGGSSGCPCTNPPTDPPFCSKCPRQDNAGHPLQADLYDIHYIHCVYQDTDCYYGPGSSTTLTWSYPDGACPNQLGEEVCGEPAPRNGQYITTICPDINQAAVPRPLRNQIGDHQCHYSNSECYYDSASGNLDTTNSIEVGSCPPAAVGSHSVYVE